MLTSIVNLLAIYEPLNMACKQTSSLKWWGKSVELSHLHNLRKMWLKPLKWDIVVHMYTGHPKLIK